MLLSQIAIVLFVPPVNLVWLALAGWCARRHRAGRAVTGAALILLLVLGLPAVSEPLLRSLEGGLADGDRPGQAQAIVLLGADVAAGITASGQLTTEAGPLSLERVRTAALLARRTGLKILVSGGVVDPRALPVASVMAGSLQRDFATPATWIEATSLDTWQNAAHSAVILRRLGISRVLLVTHAWHMRRALIAFDAAGIAATPVPVRRDRPPDLRPGDFVPHAADWIRSYDALHEWIGCMWYTVRRWNVGRSG